ncbi:MAG: ABC transporter ATP-binding protein [Lentimicrobium sp.]|jgi:lipoprotein-releasing system ATP-binding protein|uniref:ABC transporter ATP-binding protein n=1 Tax=Lentimicrobium sp. TaxID=2034841 RepID=UPI002600B779|nr:ABC transporter ATP-binding protein [Lentimicrobium sp.]MCO5256513.1 ABC transporter ATP-binding protein [Lentimicrobium sp.]MCO5261852.1 ABC transporter ATP-binding protein [Lentimicrobium sp.]HOP13367.1 ABC transporter ATP-binding protein [Lentimicrobium sp.]HPF64456.1 ABC transporter ATP-binding protein [Lentimicrobium sp.]HPJ62054.1 ABC transporter ATP-binding protein [Lentimicrobium sp.]
MIQAKEIVKSYGSLKVLKGVSVQINKGEIVSVTGASGAGKSTLLHILSTIDRADNGYVAVDGIDTGKLNDRKLAEFRNRKVGFVFQFHHLLPEFTALENVCIPAFIAGTGRKQAEKKAMELLEFLNLQERAAHKPAELSGGEQQRIAVARALVNNPSVIMADEPSGNLDSVNARQLHQLFFDLREKFNQTILIVTHNEELAGMSDRRLYMRDGLIYNQKA